MPLPSWLGIGLHHGLLPALFTRVDSLKLESSRLQRHFWMGCYLDIIPPTDLNTELGLIISGVLHRFPEIATMHRVPRLNGFQKTKWFAILTISHVLVSLAETGLTQNNKTRTKRCTEWLPVSRPMLVAIAPLASVAPRVAIGDRGR